MPPGEDCQFRRPAVDVVCISIKNRLCWSFIQSHCCKRDPQSAVKIARLVYMCNKAHAAVRIYNEEQQYPWENNRHPTESFPETSDYI